nr:hypothetical protein [Tanacetum cinerariifolium]
MNRGDMDERYKSVIVAKGGAIYYGLPLPGTMLNDTIDPTKGMPKDTRAEGVRKTVMGKGPMRRGEGGVPEPAEERITNIVLKMNLDTKEKTTSKDKKVKEKPVEETPYNNP